MAEDKLGKETRTQSTNKRAVHFLCFFSCASSIPDSKEAPEDFLTELPGMITPNYYGHLKFK